MMIRFFLLTFLLLSAAFGSLSASANNDCPSPEGKSRAQMFKEIQEFKIKYLAQEMDLSDEQKQPFTELYDEMSKKRFAVMKAVRKIERQVKNDKNATEADYQKVTEAISDARVKDAAIEKEYDGKFSKFLTQKQIFKMKSAEESFRKKMEKIRHKDRKHRSK